ncbi:MBL fold metallo-hydrolase [Candidatus Dojkabacteria bacterium]|uniref:Metallo-beta-lactamase domain-containing protein 1 n=1 Tax=Candidatus Dojkabacteria bacterium TaxID=2099670 RepID=A0A955KZ61_9BACT|nr:MBL fold metallo-hydrolase [Candidatus Dojkabacteria bacterium]
MNKIKVLIEGYARENAEGGWDASSSTVLIESAGKKVLVDPGANEKLLLSELKEEGLGVKDIDIVFMTHYHPDHFLNIRLFPDHAIYDGDTIYESDKETMYEGKIPGTEIEIISTPGHAHEQVSLLVDVGGEKYVVAEDVFWWIDGEQKTDTVEELMDLTDPFVKDPFELKSSREKVLEVADWIIPGHGKMFRNPARN